MLSEYEAAMLTRLKATDASRRIARPDNRIGATLVALSLLAAAGLLHTTVSGQSEYARAKQGATDGRVLAASAAAEMGTSVIVP